MRHHSNVIGSLILNLKVELVLLLAIYASNANSLLMAAWVYRVIARDLLAMAAFLYHAC